MSLLLPAHSPLDAGRVGGRRLTAIRRTTPSAPARWIHDNVGITQPALDYGCGHGCDAASFGMDRYDPLFPEYSTFPQAQYATVLCTYVLNVIDCSLTRALVVANVKSRVAPGGACFITVRRDKSHLNGRTSRGTWQGLIHLDWPVIHRTGGYVIYGGGHEGNIGIGFS